MPKTYDKRRPRIPEDLGQEIDAARGGIPFDAFVREALRRAVTTSSPGPKVERVREAMAPPARPARPTSEQIAATTGHHAGCRCITCHDVSTGRTATA